VLWRLFFSGTAEGGIEKIRVAIIFSKGKKQRLRHLRCPAGGRGESNYYKTIYINRNCKGFAAKEEFFYCIGICFSKQLFGSFLFGQKRTKKAHPKKITSLFRGGSLIKLLYYCTSAFIN